MKIIIYALLLHEEILDIFFDITAYFAKYIVKKSRPITQVFPFLSYEMEAATKFTEQFLVFIFTPSASALFLSVFFFFFFGGGGGGVFELDSIFLAQKIE